MKGALAVILVVALLGGGFFVLSAGGFLASWIGEGAQVAREEHRDRGSPSVRLEGREI